MLKKAKPKPYSRRQLLRLRAEWMARNRWLIAATVAFATVSGLALTVWCLLMAPGSRIGWYVLGLVHAALVAALFHVLNLGFLVTDRDALRHARGAWGEENTRAELETAKRRRLLWGWVDSIDLPYGDIDHLVVTRRGGVLALDSKWRSHTNSAGVVKMADDAKRVKVRADGLAQSVLNRTERRGRHQHRGKFVSVRPVVVVWGAEARRIPNGAVHRHGVDFVAGQHLRVWIAELDGEDVDRQAGRQLVRLLERRRTRHPNPRLP